MIRAVAFDLDGTFIDSTEAIVASFWHTFDTLGLERPPREELIDSIGYVLEDHFRQVTDHDPKECVEVYREHYRRTAPEKTLLMPGAIDCIEAFREKGLKLAFVTSKKRDVSELLLDHLDVLRYFDIGIGPEDVSNPKPDPEGLEICLKRFRVSREELCFIGDSAFDVGAAQNAGVTCIAVTTGYDSREKLVAMEPDAVLDSLEEVRAHILHRVEHGD